MFCTRESTRPRCCCVVRLNACMHKGSSIGYSRNHSQRGCRRLHRTGSYVRSSTGNTNRSPRQGISFLFITHACSVSTHRKAHKATGDISRANTYHLVHPRGHDRLTAVNTSDTHTKRYCSPFAPSVMYYNSCTMHGNRHQIVVT